MQMRVPLVRLGPDRSGRRLSYMWRRRHALRCEVATNLRSLRYRRSMDHATAEAMPTMQPCLFVQTRSQIAGDTYSVIGRAESGVELRPLPSRRAQFALVTRYKTTGL